MKKIVFGMMLMASVAGITSCSADDPFDSNYNSVVPGGNSTMVNGGNSGNSSAGSGELLSYAVTIDKTTAEPAATADAYYPEEEDDIAQNTFTTEPST